jgi:antitoxin (DNA-binding transcriptional repressor) of toxin-antitoxin stability system
LSLCEMALDDSPAMRYHQGVIVTAEIETRQLADLIKQVQAGNEVLLTQGNKPVAKIVSALENEISAGAVLNIRSIKGHRVLTPVISQGELAEEMFGLQ